MIKTQIERYVDTLYRKDGILNVAVIRRQWFKNSAEYAHIKQLTDWIFNVTPRSLTQIEAKLKI